jgi:hypothetical protein
MRIKIDYTVYAPNHQPGKVCWDLRNLRAARRKARALGAGSEIVRNFNQTNKRGKILGDWWTGNHYWIWTGSLFRRRPDLMAFPGSQNPR